MPPPPPPPPPSPPPPPPSPPLPSPQPPPPASNWTMFAATPRGLKNALVYYSFKKYMFQQNIVGQISTHFLIRIPSYAIKLSITWYINRLLMCHGQNCQNYDKTWQFILLFSTTGFGLKHHHQVEHKNKRSIYAHFIWNRGPETLKFLLLCDQHKHCFVVARHIYIYWPDS